MNSVCKKKKIAFLIPSLGAGGAERVVVSLANKFADKYEVFLLVFTKTETVYIIEKSVNIIYLKEKDSPSFSIIDAIKSNIIYVKKILKTVKKNKIAILIGFTTSVNILTIISSKILNKPHLISERNNPEVYVPNVFWKVLRNLSYPTANQLIVQTDLIKGFYQSFIKENKINIIPNPVDEILLSKRAEYLERENIILNVGRLDENKNQMLLIEVFSNLNLDNWKLVIVGDGILRDVYRKLVKNLNIEQKVEFVGNVQNVWDYYNQAKIFAFTSNSEGFPNALLEAMSFGLPCISTDCPSGPSEIIKDNENGYLIEVNNREQLGDKLSILMNNPEICNQFSQNAITSTQKFSMVEVKKLWEVQIKKLL
jgi:GalNAc-alpha-(1->4)-GalNAc-alpha-(1->3)-diNAcBac-PP-undecaprenol alpha-1,4-N-acetyl-D-galactosaminyltransferase